MEKIPTRKVKQLVVLFLAVLFLGLFLYSCGGGRDADDKTAKKQLGRTTPLNEEVDQVREVQERMKKALGR